MNIPGTFYAIKIKILYFIVFAGIYFVAQSQQDSMSKPKIGLVLSGGGAKGMAHIGVLKVLEEKGIKPDYITGTSMGAIVGSMYAAGYTARQIDSIFHTLDFDRIMFNKIDRKYKPYYQKERGEKYILSVPYSLHKMSVQLPKGLTDSQQLYNAIAHNLWFVSPVDDFSKLEIPFLCVATDISTGKQVLFNKGDLAEAVTASASLPSMYAPMEINRKPLLDGGISNNYPVEEAKFLGSDIIIGSDVQGRILHKDEIDDITKIMDQLVSFQMYKRMPLKKSMTDIYIRPDINGIGITDFDKIDTIIKRGETAARLALQNYDIKKLQSDKALTKMNFKHPDSLLYNQIVIEGINHFKRDYILGKIGIKPKQKISYKDFLEGIQNLTGTDNFQYVHYRYKTHNKGTLYLKVKEKKTKATLNLGFHANELYGINVIGNFTNKRIFANNDMLSFDIIGGEKFRYNFDYIIDNGFQLSWGIHSSLHQFQHSVRSSDLFPDEFLVNKLDFNYLQLQNKLFAQANLGHFVYFRGGIIHQYKELFTYVFSTDDNEAYFFGKNHYFSSFVSLNFDSRDDYYFPEKGVYFNLKWNYTRFSNDYYNNFKPFSTYTFDLNYTQGFFDKFWIQPTLKTGLYYGKNPNDENLFYLGGTQDYFNYDQIVAFAPAELLSVKATKYFAPALNISIKTFENQYITTNASLLYYDLSQDLLNLDTHKIYGFNIGYAVRSFIGPLQINFGRLPQSNRNHFSFRLGYDF